MGDSVTGRCHRSSCAPLWLFVLHCPIAFSKKDSRCHEKRSGWIRAMAAGSARRRTRACSSTSPNPEKRHPAIVKPESTPTLELLGTRLKDFRDDAHVDDGHLMGWRVLRPMPRGRGRRGLPSFRLPAGTGWPRSPHPIPPACPRRAHPAAASQASGSIPGGPPGRSGRSRPPGWAARAR